MRWQELLSPSVTITVKENLCFLFICFALNFCYFLNYICSQVTVVKLFMIKLGIILWFFLFYMCKMSKLVIFMIQFPKLKNKVKIVFTSEWFGGRLSVWNVRCVDT